MTRFYPYIMMAALLAPSFPIAALAQIEAGPGPSTGQGMAKLAIYRPKRFTGSGLTPSVFIDDRQVFRMDNGRYILLAVHPGKHTVHSSMKHAPLPIEVEPGSTTYIEMVLLMGVWRGGGRLLPVAENDAKDALKKLKPLDGKWIVERDILWNDPPVELSPALQERK